MSIDAESKEAIYLANELLLLVLVEFGAKTINCQNSDSGVAC